MICACTDTFYKKKKSNINSILIFYNDMKIFFSRKLLYPCRQQHKMH